ncbi:MAG: hypothetical protein EB021_12760, partial [Gammaproteobacteria bacterium]|nr:hypothetical protein [Gammaproteobacteria bacterium]
MMPSSIESAHRPALATALLLCLAACSGAPRESLPPPISAAEYERHIVTLASDDFEGRKPGTAGE